jgi:hypothetical protein
VVERSEVVAVILKGILPAATCLPCDSLGELNGKIEGERRRKI